MADQNVRVSLQFTADTSQAINNMNQLKTMLNNISSNTTIGINSGSLQQAVQSAQLLDLSLEKAVNVDTGKLDLTKLNNTLKQAGTNLNTLSNNLIAVGPQGQQAFLKLATAVSQAEVPMHKMSKTLTSMGTTLFNTIKWSISSAAINAFTGSISEAVTHAKNLNAALNDIRIVTGYSTDYMANFAVQASKAADALSTTTTEFSKAALIFYQQGLSGDAVLERAETVIKLANVTGQTAQQVSDQMTSIWNNFSDGSKSLEYYADVLTKLGAVTAANTTEISTAMEKFAATAEVIGLSYETAAAAVATVVAETRQSAEVVGTAYKTMFARIQGLKLGETLEDGVGLNQYSEALNKIGVKVLDASGNMREMDDILADLGNKWITLSEAQQTATAQTVAGIRQYSQFMALMKNWDKVLSNVRVAELSEGELTAQQEIWSESWEAASNRVKKAKDDLYEKFLNDDALVKLTDGFAAVIETVGKFIDSLGGVGPMLLTLTGVFSQTLFPLISAGFMKLRDSIHVFTGQALQETVAIQQETSAKLQQQLEGNRQLTETEKEQLRLSKELLDAKSQLTVASRNMTTAQKEAAKTAFELYEHNVMLTQESLERKRAIEEEIDAQTRLYRVESDTSKISRDAAVYSFRKSADANGQDKARTDSIIEDALTGKVNAKEKIAELTDKSKSINTTPLSEQLKNKQKYLNERENAWKNSLREGDLALKRQDSEGYDAAIEKEQKALADIMRTRQEIASLQTKNFEKEDQQNAENKAAIEAQLDYWKQVEALQRDMSTRPKSNTVVGRIGENSAMSAEELQEYYDGTADVSNYSNAMTNALKNVGGQVNSETGRFSAEASIDNLKTLYKEIGLLEQKTEQAKGAVADLSMIIKSSDFKSEDLVKSQDDIKKLALEMGATENQIGELDLAFENLKNNQDVEGSIKNISNTLENLSSGSFEASLNLDALGREMAETLKSSGASPEVIDRLVRKLREQNDESAKGARNMHILGDSYDDFEGKLPSGTQSLGQMATSLASTAGQVMMLASSFNMLKSAFDENATPMERFMSVLSFMSMGLPSIISLMGGLKKVFTENAIASAENAVANGVNAVSEKVAAEATEDHTEEIIEKNGATTVENHLTEENTKKNIKNAISEKFKNGKQNLTNAGKNIKTGFQNLGSHLSKAAPVLAPIALTAAAFAAIWYTVDVANKKLNEHNEKVKEAAKLTKALQETASQTQEKFEEFKNTISNYESAKDGLKELTKGTVEYKEALVKANEEALKLIQKYDDIKYERDADGLIKINEASLDEVYEKELNKTISAKNAALQAQNTELELRNQAKQIEFNREYAKGSNDGKFGAEDQAGATMMAGGGIAAGLGATAIIGAALNWWNPVGWALGIIAAIGGIATVAAGANQLVANEATKEESEALKVLANEARKTEYAGGLTENEIRRILENSDTKWSNGLIDSLEDNAEATDKLIQEMIKMQDVIHQNTISILSNKYDSNVAPYLTQKYNERIEIEISKMQESFARTGKNYGLDTELTNILDEYAEVIGESIEWSTNTIQKHNGKLKAVKINKETGKSEYIDIETILSLVAEVRASGVLDHEAKKVEANLEKLPEEIREANEYFLTNQKLSGDMTEEQLTNYIKAVENNDIATAFGYENNDAFAKETFDNYEDRETGAFEQDIKDGAEALREGIKKIEFNNEELKTVFDSFKNDKNLTFNAKQNLANVLNNLYDETGLVGVEEFKKQLGNVDASQRSAYLQTFASTDWKAADLDTVVQNFKNNGVDITATALSSLHGIMKDGVPTIENTAKAFGKLIDKAKNIKIGDIIEAKDYLEYANLGLSNYFTQMADGTYQLTKDAADFYNTVFQKHGDVMQNNINSIQDTIDELDSRLSFVNSKNIDTSSLSKAPVFQDDWLKGQTNEVLLSEWSKSNNIMFAQSDPIKTAMTSAFSTSGELTQTEGYKLTIAPKLDVDENIEKGLMGTSDSFTIMVPGIENVDTQVFSNELLKNILFEDGYLNEYFNSDGPNSGFTYGLTVSRENLLNSLIYSYGKKDRDAYVQDAFALLEQLGETSSSYFKNGLEGFAEGTDQEQKLYYENFVKHMDDIIKRYDSNNLTQEVSDLTEKKKQQYSLLANEATNISELDAYFKPFLELNDEYAKAAYKKRKYDLENINQYEGVDLERRNKIAQGLVDTSGGSITETIANEIALDMLRQQMAYEAANENLETWRKNLIPSKEGTIEYIESLQGLKGAVSDLVDIGESDINNDYLLNPEKQELINSALKGNTKSVKKLREELIKLAAIKNFGGEEKVNEAYGSKELDGFKSELDQLGYDVSSFGSLLDSVLKDRSFEIGCKITDTPKLKAVATLLSAMGVGNFNIAKFFEDLGFKDVTVYTKSTNELAEDIIKDVSTYEQAARIMGYNSVEEFKDGQFGYSTAGEELKNYADDKKNEQLIAQGNVRSYLRRLGEKGSEQDYLINEDGKIILGKNGETFIIEDNGFSGYTETENSGETDKKEFQDFDRLSSRKLYEYETKRIENIEREQKNILASAERLSGIDKVNALIQSNELTVQKTSALKTLESAATKERNDAYEDLKSIAQIIPDYYGDITNFDALQEYYFNKIENAATPEAQEQYIKEWEAYEKKYERYIAGVEKVEEVTDQITENIREAQDELAKILQTKFELDIKLNEIDLNKIKNQISLLGDEWYDQSEKMFLTSQQFTPNLENFNRVQKEIENLTLAYQQNGISSEYYTTQMEKLEKEAYTYASALNTLNSDMEKLVFSGISSISNEFQEQYKQISQLNGVLEHYSNLLGLIGKKQDYEAMSIIREAQLKVAQDEFNVSKTWYEQIKENRDQALLTLNEAVTDSQKKAAQATFDAINEVYLTAEEDYFTKAQALAEAAQAQFETTLSKNRQTLEEALTGGYTFDSLQEAMDRVNARQEDYLTKTNQIYETNKMMRTVQQAMDKTDNEQAKKKYKEFNNYLEQLSEQGQLSQYELEVAQAKYDLLEAEIALEEARNAKSTVRLTRDAEGNWGYMYTADEDKISNAEQNVADKQNALYNKGIEGVKTAKEKQIQIIKEAADEMAEIEENNLAGRYATEQEYHQAKLDAKAHYTELYRQATEQYNLASQVVTENALTELDNTVTAHSELEKQIINGLDLTEKEFSENLGKYMFSNSQAYHTWKDAVEPVANAIGKSLDNDEDGNEGLKQKTKAVTDATGDLVKKITDPKDGLIKALQDETVDIANAALAWSNQANTINTEVLPAYRDLAEVLADVAKYSLSGSLGEQTDWKAYMNYLEEQGFGPGTAIYDAANAKREEKISKMNLLDEISKEIQKGSNPESDWVQELISRALAGGATRNQVKLAIGLFNSAYYIDEALKKYPIGSFDTGGYTGAWGPDGKLAMLHQKELVLNANDTENFLQAVSILRSISEMLDQNALMASLNLASLQAFTTHQSYGQTLQQDVTIHAEFPNVQDHNEIELALADLVNAASQYAGRF